MIGFIIGLLVVGLIAGAVARLVVPGKQNLSIPATIVIGVVGSFVGGFLGYLLFRSDSNDGFFQPAGIIGSIIGAVIVLVIWINVGNADGSQTSLYNWIFQHGFAPWASPKNASLLFAMAALLVLYAVLEVLYRRRWFLRA